VMPTGIEWTDETWNPVGGCTIKSPGCAHCYAMRLAVRHPSHPVYAGTVRPSKAGPVWTGKLTTAPDSHPVWRWPLSWRGAMRPVMGEGRRSLIFVGDMSDLFHEDRAVDDIDRVFRVIGACDEERRHVFQFLTKRPDVMRHYTTTRGSLSWNAGRLGSNRWPAQNIWLGCSVERQQEADARREHMRA